ncbi:MAG: hypothetical protein Q4F00_09855 [bacterium]|nr:hypothetical protein [bacterium]
MRQTFRFPSAKPQQISKNERPFSKHHHGADQRGAAAIRISLAGRLKPAVTAISGVFQTIAAAYLKARLTDLKFPLNALFLSQTK